MSELEPDDSRDVTGSQARAPGEPPRTGPREGEAHRSAGQTEQGQGAAPQAGGDRAIEGDAPNHPDRFGGTAESSGQAEAEESDRWSRKADDAEDYVPEGK